MKKSPLTLVGVLCVLSAIILTALNMQKTPQTKQTQTTEEKQVFQTARTRTNLISSEDIVVVEYSTKAFLKTENQ